MIKGRFDGEVRKRVCGDCRYATTDPDDDEDIYFCPFDKEFAFHSGEPCSHEEEYRRAEEEKE